MTQRIVIINIFVATPTKTEYDRMDRNICVVTTQKKAGHDGLAGSNKI
ncbi:MAG: hypothetical protein GY936_14155 [Ignavibacteriae bacterium]|nr:hypothetical protein [Ignavibacteriota bacterium]